MQCGFCSAGILMNMAEFVRTNRKSTEDEIRNALVGNLCRCTGYAHIVDAIKEVAGDARLNRRSPPTNQEPTR